MGCQNSIDSTSPTRQKYEFSPELFVRQTNNPEQVSPLSSKASGIIERSIRHYQDFLESHPLLDQPFDGLGCPEDQIGHYEGCIERWYRSEREKGTIQGNPYDALSLCYSVSDCLEEGERWYQRMLVQRVGSFQLWMGLGNIYYKKGDFCKAEEIYKKVIDLNPRIDRAYLNIAYIYCYHLHDNDRALEWASFASKINKHNPYAALIKETVRDNPQGKMAGLLKLHIRYPQYTRISNAIGLQYLYNSQLEEAISWFQNALQKNPDFNVARCGLAIAYNLQGRQDAAIKLSQESISLNPSHHEPYLTMGQAYASKGQVDEAEKWYKKCILTNPSLKIGYIELARLYLKEGRNKQALEILQKGEVSGEVLEGFGKDYLSEMGLQVSKFEMSCLAEEQQKQKGE